MNDSSSDIVDAKWYLREYPDVAQTGMAPAEHYTRIGKLLGRAPAPRAGGNGIEVRHLIAHGVKFSAQDEVALLVTHAPAGRLKPHVLPYMQQLREAGLAVLLVAVVDRPLELLEAEIEAATEIIVRDNAGYDFGAWVHGIRLCPSVFDAKLLVITNDSVVPTADRASFQMMIDRVRASGSDITGLTANHEHGWHVQSYFLAFARKALASSAVRDFVRDVRRIDDKDEVIHTYEIPFARQMRAKGLTVDTLFHGPYANNPVIWGWRDLVESGFPFVKVLLLSKTMYNFPDANGFHAFLDDAHTTWPEALEPAGFDVKLMRRVMRAAEIAGIPKGAENDLLVESDLFQQA